MIVPLLTRDIVNSRKLEWGTVLIIKSSSEIIIDSFSYWPIFIYFLASAFIFLFLYYMRLLSFSLKSIPVFTLTVLINLGFTFSYFYTGVYGNYFTEIIDFDKYPYLQDCCLLFSFLYAFLIPRAKRRLKWLH